MHTRQSSLCSRRGGQKDHRRGLSGVLTNLMLLALLAACGGPQQKEPSTQTALKVIRGRVLKGEGGIQVTILDLEGKQALIQVTGVLSPINDKVLRHQLVEDGGSSSKYMMSYKGAPWYTIWEESQSGETRWRLFYPESPQGQLWLSADEQKTAALDADKLVALHLEQQKRGELEAVTRFDRQEAIAKHEKELDRRRKILAQKCGASLSVKIDWPTVTDEMLTSNSFVVRSLNTVVSGVDSLCIYQAGKSFLRNLAEVRLAADEKLMLRLEDKTLHVGLAEKTHNLSQNLRTKLLELNVTPDETLGQQITLERTHVCLGKEDRMIVLAPQSSEHPGISYGRKGTLFRVRPTRHWSYPSRFFEPRFPLPSRTPQSPPSFVSEVSVDTTKNTCTLRCGKITRPFQRADLQTAKRLLAKAVFKPSPFQRQPYALARDMKGVYYYVDQAVSTSGQKDFRVYIGQRGDCKRQQMKDIVSDSEGEIFVTARGKLRLVINRFKKNAAAANIDKGGLWISPRATRKLRLLPIKENLPLIFNELGPYLGQPLGTPCDDI